MRILLVVHGFPPSGLAGTEIYAEAQARCFDRVHGDEILVLTREHDTSAREYRVRRERREGVSIAWVNNSFCATRSFEESYRHPAIAAIAAHLIDQFQPDIAHVHHLTCLSTEIVEALETRGIPCVLTLHDYWLLCHRGQLLDLDGRVCRDPAACHSCLGGIGSMAATFTGASVIRSVERRLPQSIARPLRDAASRAAALVTGDESSRVQHVRRADHLRRVCLQATRILAPSAFIRERFIDFGIPPARMTTVALGVDHTPFSGINRPPAKCLRFGFLGSLMLSKAPHLLLEAFARLPRGAATLDVIGAQVPYHGDDTYRSRIEPLLRLEGVRVHGAVPHDRVVELLAAIDVLVVPSIWPENSPLVIREAFLAGIPVVASRLGGLPEIVEHEQNGLLFAPGDRDDLQRALQRVIDEPQLLERLRAGIPKVVTIEQDVSQTRDLYRSLIRTVNRPRAESAVPASFRQRLAAVVLNYRTPDQTQLAVRSLLASHRPIDDLIVVDNDDPPDSRNDVSPLGTRVRWIDTGRNLGFSGGMNVGIRAALASGADRVLLVNSDVIVHRDCVEELERCLDSSAGAGIVGPVVVARSNPSVVNTLGVSYAAATGRMRHVGFLLPTASLDLPAHRVVDAVSGCAMLISRSVFEKIGLLDEDYFFSFEDLAFCLNARRAGFVTLLAGGARVDHEGGQSIGAQSRRRLYFAARNHLRAADRSSPAAGWLAGAVRGSSIVLLNLAHAVRSPGGSPWERIAAVIRGTADYLSGRFGDDERHEQTEPRHRQRGLTSRQPVEWPSTRSETEER